MAERLIKVGLAGFGIVGAGVAKIILEEADAIAARTGIRLELARVVDLDTSTDRPVRLPKGLLTDKLDELINDESISIGVELIGGTGAAKDIQLKMLQAGKDVVTANKALLAEHGNELFEAAQANGRCIAFEASCAGGIPIVSAIRTSLAANNITAMYGIVNGTCNYILSSMSSKDKDFAEALAQAQQKGFAEADPTLDISGGDSAHKLAILSSIAFGYEITPGDIFVEGIEQVSKDDIRYGQEMGYAIKLLAIAQRRDDEKISLRVHPSFILNDVRLAGIDGSFNAVSIFGNAVGELIYYGRGAGMMPTASAVVADVIEVAMGNSAVLFSHMNLKPNSRVKPLIEKIGDCVSRFYIRMMVKDQPGVFAGVARILAENSVSISGILQHEDTGPDNTIPVIITTHQTPESKISAALEGLNKLDTACSKAVCIRIVDIPEDRD